jgi:hypothetical protein
VRRRPGTFYLWEVGLIAIADVVGDAVPGLYQPAAGCPLPGRDLEGTFDPVWTAPLWQGSSRASAELVGAAMCSACGCGA